MPPHKTGTTICGVVFHGGARRDSVERILLLLLVNWAPLDFHSLRTVLVRFHTTGRSRRRHEGDQLACCGQELRKNSLHSAEHILLWRRHCGRHGDDDGADQFEAGTAARKLLQDTAWGVFRASGMRCDVHFLRLLCVTTCVLIITHCRFSTSTFFWQAIQHKHAVARGHGNDHAEAAPFRVPGPR